MMLSMLAHDFKLAVRSLRANGAGTIVIAAVVALGIGANTAVFSVARAVLLRPLSYPDADRLFAVTGVTAAGKPTQIVPGAFESLRDGSKTMEAATLIRMRAVTISGKEGAESSYAQALAGDGLRAFGTPPLLGRLFHPDSSNEVVLSHRLWMRRYGGDADILGRSITLHETSFIVVGVMPREFETTNRAFELWMPWRFTASELAERTAGGFQMLARRHPSASEDELRSELLTLGQAFAQELSSPDLKGWRISITPLLEQRVGPYRHAVLVLLGAVGFVFVIVCLNVACLLLARAQDRRKEVSLKLALGATQVQVMRQFLLESLILSVSGGFLGVLIASWGTRAIVALAADRAVLPRLGEATVDGSVLLFSIALTVAAGVAFGLAPAMHALRLNVQETLKESGGGFTGNRKVDFVRNSAVVLQVALALVLLTGSGLLMRSFVNLLRTDPGFRADRVLTVRIPSGTGQGNEVQLAERYASILESAIGIPDVQAAALSTVIPFGPAEATSTLTVDGPGALDAVRRVQYRAVSPSYFQALAIPLLRGRSFEKHDSLNAPDVAIVNDVAARRYWPGENPIGKRIATSSDNGKPKWMTVIGVVGGVRQNLRSEPPEELYRPYTQHLFGAHGAMLLLRTGQDPRFVVDSLTSLLRRSFPEQPLGEVRTMEEWLDRSLTRPRFDAVLLTVFAAIALIIASMGVYALISYGVRRRWREIGVRIALGASPGDISRLVVRRAGLLVISGLFIGIAGSFALTRLLSSQLYGVEPNEPSILAAGGALLLGTGLLASWGPARWASQVDPGITLRQE